MNLRYTRGEKRMAPVRLPVLIFLAGCFGAGLVAGCILASYLGRDALTCLSVYLNDYFALLEQGQTPDVSLLSAFWEVFRWPLMALAFGLTAFGAAAVPILFCLRGFLLSYAVSVFVQLFGLAGLPAAMAVFGLSAVTSVTALFITGLDAFEWGRSLALSPRGQEVSAWKGQVILHTLVCACWLTVGALTEYWLSPVLLKAAVDLVL